MAAEAKHAPSARERTNFAPRVSPARDGLAAAMTKQQPIHHHRTSGGEPLFPDSWGIEAGDKARDVLGEVFSLTKLLATAFSEAQIAAEKYDGARGQMSMVPPLHYELALSGLGRLVSLADFYVERGMGEGA